MKSNFVRKNLVGEKEYRETVCYLNELVSALPRFSKVRYFEVGQILF